MNKKCKICGCENLFEIACYVSKPITTWHYMCNSCEDISVVRKINFFKKRECTNE